MISKARFPRMATARIPTERFTQARSSSLRADTHLQHVPVSSLGVTKRLRLLYPGGGPAEAESSLARLGSDRPPRRTSSARRLGTLRRPDKRGQVARGGEPSATGYRDKALAPCSFCSEELNCYDLGGLAGTEQCLCGVAARRVSGRRGGREKTRLKDRVRGGTGQRRA